MNKTLLIVASSGRMLACSARRAGYKPLVVDLFADQDTRDVAEVFRMVKSLALNEILPVINLYFDRYDVREFVYGSGLEIFPESLERLNQRFHVFGNSYSTFHRLINKKEFFQTLIKLGIPFPQIHFQTPDNKQQWLIKPIAGEGGIGIRAWQRDSHVQDSKEHVYWQQKLEGISASVLFLADGQNVQIVGFNQQWTETGSFVFSGIIKLPELSENIQDQVFHWLIKLVPEYSLSGLNSLDFIVDGEHCQVLEINPRPSASMILYDTEFISGLVQEHINACSGKITFNRHSHPEIIAFQVLYASKDLYIASGFDWPDWSMDRPVCPCKIYHGQPICSIIATDTNSQLVFQQLQNKQQIIFDLIEGK